MVRQRALLALAVVVLFSLSYVPQPSLALNQQATELRADMLPGETRNLDWVLISDSSVPTVLYFDAEGLGYQFLSFQPSVELQPGEVKHFSIVVTIPSDYQAPADLAPRMFVVETLKFDTATSEPVDTAERDVLIKVSQPAASSGTSAQNTTSSQSTTTNAGSTQTTSGTTSSATTTQTTPTTSQTTQTTTQTTSSVTQQQNATSGTVWGVDTVLCIPESAGESCGRKICKQTTRDQSKFFDGIFDTREKCERFVEDINKKADAKKPFKSKLLKKIATKIGELREESVTNKAGSSDKHDFDIRSGDLKKVELEFSKNVGEVKVVVETLAVSRVEESEPGIETVVNETGRLGVVETPVEIVPDEAVGEDVKSAVIEIEGASLPDIESRAVKDEVVGETEKGEVVRRVTKKKAYKYLEIDLSGAAKGEVEKAIIDFTVEKSWVTENGIKDLSVIRLNRFADGAWQELPTRLLSEDTTSYQFSAESPGFSFFVITAAITADITTPISIEVPEVQQQAAGQEDDFVGDLIGTTQPQSLLTINISWLLAVVVLGAIVLFKWNDIRRALSYVNAKSNRAKELEAEKARYERMKEETTKKFYKRVLSEEEFKNLVMEYDRNIIRLETEIAELRGREKQPPPKQP